MKKALIILLSLAFVFAAQAQSFQFGLKAGVNQSQLSKSPNTINSDYTLSYVGGAYLQLSALGLLVMPEVLFTQRKGLFQDINTKQELVNSLTYMDVPLLVGYKLVIFRAYAGPNFQFLLDASQSGSGTKDPNFSKASFNDAVVGIQAGVGLNIWKICVDLRYDTNLSKVGKVVNTVSGTQVNYSTRASMYQLTVGYRLF